MITAQEIYSTVERYLAKFPDERQDLWELANRNPREAQLLSRTEFRGHVTAGAVVVDSDWRVLHVKHRTLGRWLLPGGHLEAWDYSLPAAALRELYEKTGIATELVEPIAGFEDVPIDIDVHAIPSNLEKAEPEHRHFDFRYVFRASTTSIELRRSEVTAWRWVQVDKIVCPDLAERLETVHRWIE